MAGAIGDMVEIAGFPAEKAGLKPGDVIFGFNGRPVRDILGLRTLVADSDIGARIELRVLRAGEELTLTAQIAEAPMQAATAPRRGER